MQDDTRIVDLILDIHKDLGIMKEHMGELRADMRTHIKRTDQVETELKYLHKQISIAHGGIALVGLAGSIFTLIKYLS